MANPADTLCAMKETVDSLRIDRWLYFCRFFKTRSKATAAVTGGHVRVNGERASPGHRVQPGDRVDLVRERLLYVLTVTAIPTRRGPASEAQACYVEDEARRRNEPDYYQAARDLGDRCLQWRVARGLKTNIIEDAT